MGKTRGKIALPRKCELKPNNGFSMRANCEKLGNIGLETQCTP